MLNYLSWKELNRSFEALGAVGFATFTLTGRGDPEQITGANISPSLMPLLGIRPMLGRGFQQEEERPGAVRVALISQALWMRRFAGQRSVPGSPIVLNGQSYTIVGIAPAGLPFLPSGDIWTPLIIDPAREIRLNHVLTVFGRLRAGVSPRQAQNEMNAVARRVGEQQPGSPGLGHSAYRFRPDDRFAESAHRSCRAAGRGWIRASDRLREYGQSAAHSRQRATAGNRSPRIAGGEPVAPAGAVSYRKPASVDQRRRAGRDDCCVLCAAGEPLVAAGFAARTGNPSRFVDPAVRAGNHCGNGSSFWICAGLARGLNRSQ